MTKIIEGLIVSTFADEGPETVINLSSLDEVQSMNLGVTGMTILSMGSRFQGTVHRLHGPIPVPDTENLESLSISFSVVADETVDDRVEDFGRLTNIWLLFKSSNRMKLISHHAEIENLLKEEILKFKHEREIRSEETFKNMLNRIEELLVEKEAEVPVIVDEKVVKEIQQVMIPLFIYSVDFQGDLVDIPISKDLDLFSYPVLILVNTIIKQIFVIKVKEDASPRKVFLSTRAASGLNTTQFKNEYHIRNVTDPLELDLLFETLATYIRAI